MMKLVMKMTNDDIFFSTIIPVIQVVSRRYPKARQPAIENFLITAINYSMTINMLNLEYDRKLYRWDKETYSAILHGLQLLHALGVIK